MNYVLKTSKTTWNNIEYFVSNFISEIGNKNDGFWNDIVYQSNPYIININDETAGFFAIGNAWEKGKMLSAFYMQANTRRYSKDVFETILNEFSIVSALVASNDEHFLCLAFETMKNLNTSFEMQAYNFSYGESIKEPQYKMESISVVSTDEYDFMNTITEKQWDGCFNNPNFQFYKLEKDNKVLGYGAICTYEFNKYIADIGNFTLPEFRQMGVGRSIIINLSKIAKSKGFIPVCGCWYGNTNSILTLKSSGFVPNSRLFYIKFK